MAAIFAIIAGLGFGLGLVAALALLALGLFVTRRHPAEYDPARNAPRFVRPAGVLVALIALGVLAFIVGLIGAAIASLT